MLGSALVWGFDDVRQPAKRSSAPTQRRFVYPLIALAVLLLIALGWGLKYSMDFRARLCPPAIRIVAPCRPHCPPPPCRRQHRPAEDFVPTTRR
jgi:hypothetical protein